MAAAFTCARLSASASSRMGHLYLATALPASVLPALLKPRIPVSPDDPVIQLGPGEIFDAVLCISPGIIPARMFRFLVTEGPN